jgi:hypothetical protein
MVEFILAAGISALLAAAMVQVLFTVYGANHTSDSRLQASAQIRNFQLAFHDDLVLAASLTACANPCTTLTISGNRLNQNATSPCAFSVTYTFTAPSGTNPYVPGKVTRTVSGRSIDVARNVPSLTFYVATDNTVTGNITVQDSSRSYSETQSLLFHPRPTAAPSPTPSPCP